MTLLLTVIAAVVSTFIWYSSEKARALKISALCYMFWGASIMWFVDAIYEYAELKEVYFTPPVADMLNDTYLGLSVIALALVVWMIIVLVKDPLDTVKNAIKRV
jgi:hypothetical protein